MRASSTSTVFFVSGVSVIGLSPFRLSATCGGAGRKSMPLSFTISDLRQCPEFFDIVADRIWQAWWRADGHPLDYISGRLRENMNATSIPFALVAHDGETFLGTAPVIASDLAERPQFTPWVAAGLGEPQARRRGVGGGRVNRAALGWVRLGVRRRYQCVA